jgi:hypothetical protein
LYVEDVSGVNVGTFFHRIHFCCWIFFAPCRTRA